MQKVANLETVSRACQQLQAEGQKITGRAVVAITGGSLGTVLSLIKDWREGAGLLRSRSLKRSRQNCKPL